MFKDTPLDPTTRAPGERNVCGDEICEIGYVSLLRSEENLLELPFYKHYVPTGRGAASEALVKETRIDRLL